MDYHSINNLTSDGTNTYSYDAENRLIQVSYPGDGNYSQFTYDGLGHCVEIVETVGESVSSTKQFVWSGSVKRESRDGDGDVLSQYFNYGQTIGGDDYFYTKDHLASVRELTDTSGNIQAQYEYDSYGRVSQVQGGLASEFQYAGYYFHAPSGLGLTVNRPYSAAFARFINRDPGGESKGVNLYDYTFNTPINFIDPLGLQPSSSGGTEDAPGGVTSVLGPGGYLIKGGIGSGSDPGSIIFPGGSITGPNGQRIGLPNGTLQQIKQNDPNQNPNFIQSSPEFNDPNIGRGSCQQYSKQPVLKSIPNSEISVDGSNKGKPISGFGYKNSEGEDIPKPPTGQ